MSTLSQVEATKPILVFWVAMVNWGSILHVHDVAGHDVNITLET